ACWPASPSTSSPTTSAISRSFRYPSPHKFQVLKVKAQGGRKNETSGCNAHLGAVGWRHRSGSRSISTATTANRGAATAGSIQPASAIASGNERSAPGRQADKSERRQRRKV